MLKAKINNTEIGIFDLNISQNVTSRIDTCSFSYLKNSNKTYRPKTYDEVEIFDDDEKIFAGSITEFSDEYFGADLVKYQIQCSDYTFLFDRKLVAETYEKKTVTEIVKDIVENFSDGFTSVNVEETDEEIKFIQFDYVRPTDALQDLADLIMWDWYVDYNKDIHFFSKGSRTAPFSLTDTSTNYNTKSLKLKKSSKQIRNVVFVVGSNYVGEEVSDKVGQGDGVQKRWNLPYSYDKMPEVKLDGVVQNVGVEYLNTVEDGFTCFWNATEKVVSFETAPVSGDIVVKGFPLIPIFVKVKAPNNQIGDYEYKIVDKTLKTEEAVRQRAKSEIDIYSNAVDSGSFTTTKKGLEVGQKIKISSNARGIENEEYIIQTITITARTDDSLTYNVKLANIKSYEMIDFLKMLLRKDEKERESVRNSSSVLNTIISIFDKLSLQNEVLKIEKGNEYHWVWGDYDIEDLNDNTRVAVWDYGVKWK